MKETSSFYNIGYRTKKVLFSNPWFLWVITIFSFSLPTLSFPPMGVRHELPRNWWFLPNGDFMVSWCIGSRVDLVSSWRNHFYDFCSLSSLITLPCQHFAYVASHLMRIETIINAPLGLPLGMSKYSSPSCTLLVWHCTWCPTRSFSSSCIMISWVLGLVSPDWDRSAVSCHALHVLCIALHENESL